MNFKGTTANKCKDTSTLTLAELHKTIESISLKYEEPNYKPSFFERLMNRFGWYRKRVYYLIDKQKLLQFPFNIWR